MRAAHISYTSHLWHAAHLLYTHYAYCGFLLAATGVGLVLSMKGFVGAAFHVLILTALLGRVLQLCKTHSFQFALLGCTVPAMSVLHLLTLFMLRTFWGADGMPDAQTYALIMLPMWLLALATSYGLCFIFYQESTEQPSRWKRFGTYLQTKSRGF